MTKESFHLFDVYGVELEYMIVRADSLNILPVSDELIKSVAGTYAEETDQGTISWGNELVLHVIELKTTRPVSNLAALRDPFQEQIKRINEILAEDGACLMPSSMHPWMNPITEVKLWPHAYSEVYEAFNRIFDCRGHGWSNVQSIHLNLPFNGDLEFGRLHAAIRAILPILPAISASSPIFNSENNGICCNRMLAYKDNAKQIPSVSGSIIPEPYYTEEDYRRKLLIPMYADIAPHDPGGILQEDWLNSRGAIARFDRSSIEIRVMDVQEHPGADLAVLTMAASAIKALINRFDEIKHLPADFLESLLWRTVEFGGLVLIENTAYLSALGINRSRIWVKDLWFELFERYGLKETGNDQVLIHNIRHILEAGCLSGRISDAAGNDPSRSKLFDVYLELASCLNEGRSFGK